MLTDIELIETLDKIKQMPVNIDEEEQRESIDEAKAFFESKKKFMLKNRYMRGNTIIYPTSPSCIRHKEINGR